MDFDKIVKKMLKKRGKILFFNDIGEEFFPGMIKENYSKISKIIYRLCSENVVIKIKNGVYLVPKKEDLNLNEVEILDKYTLILIKKYITYFVRNDYFITGNKALELHMKNYYFGDKVFVMNRNLNKKIKIGDIELIFKTSKGKDVNLYSRLSKFTVVHNIDGLNFKSSSLELALLETALTQDSIDSLDMVLIQKVLKKYKKVLQYVDFEQLAKLRFVTSINRLKEIAKLVDDDLYRFFLGLIKKNGNLFIGEKLRGF